MTTITASFDVTKWDEHRFDVRAGAAKLTKARVTKAYKGDIQGDSVTEWLMAYASDGTASFVGLERINGSVGGRTGTLVLRHVGTYADGAAKAELSVVGGSCAGEVAGAHGAGEFVADPAGRISLDLTFG